MKLFGALQPHRADSNYWNDSFGGHTIITINNKVNSNTNSNSNRKIQIINNNNQINTKTKKIQEQTYCRDDKEDRKRIESKWWWAPYGGHGDERNDEMHKGSKSINSVGIIQFDMIRSIPVIIANMMRFQQSLLLLLISSFAFESLNLFSVFLRESRRHFQKFRFMSFSCYLTISLVLLCVFTNRALCNENENESGSSLGPEFTTLSLITVPTILPFDNATRGNKKFGDRCEDTQECGFPGSVCDPRKKSCQCIEDLPVTNHLDKCGKEAAINESCFFNEQCEAFHFQTECRSNRCACRFEMSPVVNKDGNLECKGKQMKHDEVERYVDPAMIGVLVGMALMFIIICVVLRLFSRARWRENRTIFNTPNPRLMNVSLLRDNKLMHGQERRGSRMSVRAPSRQPSMASLRPHSPNPSLGSRPGSRGSSNASAISARSTLIASNNTNDAKPTTNNNNNADSNQTLIITNIIENPAAESVTIEILQPKSNQNQ